MRRLMFGNFDEAIDTAYHMGPEARVYTVHLDASVPDDGKTGFTRWCIARDEAHATAQAIAYCEDARDCTLDRVEEETDWRE